jgi:hypothetical protein
MVAHSQFCFSGDNTLTATARAIKRVLRPASGTAGEARPGTDGDRTARLVVVVSDANFARYGIDPQQVS